MIWKQGLGQLSPEGRGVKVDFLLEGPNSIAVSQGKISFNIVNLVIFSNFLAKKGYPSSMATALGN